MPLFEQYVRPLKATERRMLNHTLSVLYERQHRLRHSLLFSCLIAFGILWGMSLAARYFDRGGPNWYQSALVCIGISALVGVVAFPQTRREERNLSKQVRDYESTLERNLAHVVHIQSGQIVELEEQEDEGACYAFQVNDNRIVFVVGQDYCASPKFPNSDFSLIQIFADDNTLLKEWIEKSGKKLNPSRVIPAEVKAKLPSPEHLQTIDGTLDELETLLRAGRILNA